MNWGQIKAGLIMRAALLVIAALAILVACAVFGVEDPPSFGELLVWLIVGRAVFLAVSD